MADRSNDQDDDPTRIAFNLPAQARPAVPRTVNIPAPRPAAGAPPSPAVRPAAGAPASPAVPAPPPAANASPRVGDATMMMVSPLASAMGAAGGAGRAVHPGTGPPPPMAGASYRAPAMAPWRAPSGAAPGLGPATGPPFAAAQVLAAPPVRLPATADPRLVLLTRPDSARAVSFRLLRDTLLAKRLPRVLTVTSAGEKEGKTTCALNLGLSLGEGARVLLVDANFASPALASIFAIDDGFPPPPPSVPWLAPYKVGRVSPGLDVAAPPLNAMPPRFDNTWFEQLIGSVRRFSYNYVLIDAPALDASPSAMQLVAMSDATLLAVRSGVTTARALRRAAEQIPDGKILGVALIDAKVP